MDGVAATVIRVGQSWYSKIGNNHFIVHKIEPGWITLRSPHGGELMATPGYLRGRYTVDPAEADLNIGQRFIHAGTVYRIVDFGRNTNFVILRPVDNDHRLERWVEIDSFKRDYARANDDVDG